MADEGTITTTDPVGLVRALEASGRFRRDTPLGGIFHHGTISFREISPTNSLHVTIDGNRVRAHIDEVCPLSPDPDGPSQYSWHRVLAHNLAGLAADVGRRVRGRHGDQRCDLECEVVWFDDDEVAEAVAELEETAPEASSRLPEPERVPFGIVDEAVHLLDTEAAPWSIQLEVRVGGRLDPARLGRAVSRALAQHPMARARKVPTSRLRHRDQWEIPDEADLNPLRVVECADDASLDATRAQLQSMSVPLAESPPFRARLVRHPDGDLLMLNVNHAAMDGFGALRVLQSVARAYAGEPDPEPALDFLEARRLPVRLGLVDVSTRLRRYLALADKLRDLVVPPARLSPDGGRDEPGYGFVHVSLSAADTRALHRPDRVGTVNDVLLAALHMAVAEWNRGHGADSGRIGVLVPANLRPPEWREDMVGNFTLPARVATDAAARRSPERALEVVTSQTRRKKTTGMGTALIEVLGHSRFLPLWAKQAMVMLMPVTGNRLVDTAMLSNLGHLTRPPSFGPDGGEVTEMWFSPPARMPLGLTIGALTVGDRLHLVFRYRHRLFDSDAARRFADLYLLQLRRYL